MGIQLHYKMGYRGSFHKDLDVDMPEYVEEIVVATHFITKTWPEPDFGM